MINCNEATYLISRSELEKISCSERISLKIHLLGCKYCLRFKKQVKIISNQITKSKEYIEEGKFLYSLSPKQNEDIQKSIENQLKRT